MDRFQSMRVYTRIVELGSFTKAAEDLQLPRASVTLAMQQLEKRLGVRLLQRTTRHVSATPEGQAFYERSRQLLADLEDAEFSIGAQGTGAGRRPQGRLRVSLQGTLGRQYVLPALAQFFDRYPEIELDIGMGDRLVDLVREGVDCALRVGTLDDSTLVARPITQLAQITCASARYLQRYGVPRTLQDLAQHHAVNFVSQRTGRVMPFEFEVDGQTQLVAMAGMVTVNDADAYKACCAAHMGLIQAPTYHLAPALAAGDVVEVLAEWRPAPMPVSLVYPQHRQISPRVRVFADWLSEVLGDVG